MGWKEKLKNYSEEKKKSFAENRAFEKELKKKRLLAQREARLKAVNDFERQKVAAKKKALLKQYNQKLNRPRQNFASNFLTGDTLGVRSSAPTRRAPTRKAPTRKRTTKRKTSTKRKIVRRRTPVRRTESSAIGFITPRSYFE